MNKIIKTENDKSSKKVYELIGGNEVRIVIFRVNKTKYKVGKNKEVIKSNVSVTANSSPLKRTGLLDKRFGCGDGPLQNQK